MKQARSLSEINYSYWWRTHPIWNAATALSLDEQKATVFYEAYRRLPAIRDAWLKGIRGPEAMHRFGWQEFVANVLIYLPKTWLELPRPAKNRFCQILPEILPPVGYSVWPAQPAKELTLSEHATLNAYNEAAKKEQRPTKTLQEFRAERLEAYHERCRKLAAEILAIPRLDKKDAFHFLKIVTKLSDAGFVIVAIDNKSREAFNYGIQFLQRRLKHRRSSRAADTYYKFPKETPLVPSLDDELDDDYARGYTWDKVRKMDKAQRDLLGAAMAQRADANAIHAICYGKGKRQKKHKGQADVILEEKVFKFQELCKELESFDKIGSPKPRGLMERLR